MSARQIQRIRTANTELQDVDESGSDEGGESEPEQGQAGNVFAALLEEDEGEVEEKEKEEKETVTDPKIETDTTSKAKSRRKRRKKKKKGKGKEPARERGKEADDDLDWNELGFDDVVAGSNEHESGKIEAKMCPIDSCLAIKPADLKVANEEMRIFGKGVARPDEGRNRARVRHRKTLLVSLESEWPRVEPGLLRLELVSASPRTFTFVRGPIYDELQREYELIIGSHEPQALVVFLQTQPYHIDALNAIGGFMERSGNAKGAFDAVGMLVAAFEAGMSSSFLESILAADGDGDGNEIRLQGQPTDMQFLTALLRYGHMCSRRGLHRTALAYASLSLRLGCGLLAHDPIGASLCVDYFALRAGLPETVMDLWNVDTDAQSYGYNPKYIVSMLYSVCLALKESNRQGPCACACACEHCAWNGTGTETRPGGCVAGALIRATLLFPAVCHALLLRADVGKEHPVFKRNLFQSDPWTGSMGTSSSPPAAARMSRIYLERSHTLWRDVGVVTLCLEAAEHAADVFDLGKGSEGRRLYEQSVLRRNEVYERIPDRYLLDADIADFAEHTDTLPDLDGQANNNNNNGNVPMIRGGGGGGGVPVDMSALELFFASFLPWFQMPPSTRDPERDM